MEHGTTQPNLDMELEALNTSVTNHGALADFLADRGQTTEATLERVAAVRKIGDRARSLAIEASMYAIEEGTMSRAKAAELLNVEPMTIGRWVKAARAGEPIHPRRRYQPPQPQ